MKLVDKLAETSGRPPSLRRRILAKVLPVIVYTIFFPAILFIIPKFYLDRLLGLPSFLSPVSRTFLGGVLLTLGLIFIVWSIKAQKEIGKGTPMPLMATQNLVIHKPYLYCRNPIFFRCVQPFFFGNQHFV